MKTNWTVVAIAIAFGAFAVAVAWGSSITDQKSRQVEIEQIHARTTKYEACIKYHKPEECK